MKSVSNDIRENNYDLLRIIATASVITIHVAGFYKNAAFDEDYFGFLYQDNMLFTWILSGICRFAVPCFIMLSGAFSLSNQSNVDWHSYYKKMFYRIGIPTFIFSMFYFVYEILRSAAKVFIHGESGNELFTPVQELLTGAPMYHMWYIYMMFGLWMLVPFIIAAKNKLSEDSFSKLSIVIVIMSIISLLTSTHAVEWEFGRSFCYLGYFLAGYLLKNQVAFLKKSMRPLNGGGGWIFFGLLLEVPDALIAWKYALNGVNYAELSFNVFSLNFLSALVAALAPIFVFYGFSCLKVGINTKKISTLTFSIYLIHAGIWNLIQNLFVEKYCSSVSSVLVILIIVGLVFALSLLLSIIYQIVYSFICERWHLDDKLYVVFNIKLFGKIFR